MKNALVLFLALGLVHAWAQDAAKPVQETAKPARGAAAGDWGTKTFDVKYADPEQLREMFADRSFVMEANRDLKVLIAHGPAAFLKEVEDTVKRFDVPPPPPANLEITVYLVTPAAQAPSGIALPPQLAAIGKEFGEDKLADSQMLRVREGLGGETTGVANTANSARLLRVRLQSASLLAGPKTQSISLNGLQVWLDVPAATGAATIDTSHSQLNTAPDVTADVDVDENKAAVVAKVGGEKPIGIAVRTIVVH
jgi:hypothetical protein